MNPEDIIITKHAHEKAEELGIGLNRIKNLLRTAEVQREHFFRGIYKFFKYGNKQKNVYYYYKKGSSKQASLLFTVKKQGGKFIVITITKKKL